jgi:putative hydrolase of the HAD superfamily
MSRNRAVFFDMGYTLVYFEPPQGVIVQQALETAGVNRSIGEIRAAIEDVWGHYYRDAGRATFPPTQEYDREVQLALGRRLLVRLGLTGDDQTLADYSHAIESRFSQPGVIRPYPEVVSVLERLKEHGYRLGIVSNWSWNLRDRVHQAGLNGYFDVVWASAYAGCNKPHPASFHQALARLPSAEVAPDRPLYVGDSYEHDVAGARNAGWDVALVDRGGTPMARDCPVISDLRGVFDLLSAPNLRPG